MRFSNLEIIYDLDGLKDSSLYPSDQEIGGLIKKGVEFEVWEYGDGWVLKKGIHRRANTLEQLKQDRAGYEFFKKYIAENLPKTFHFRAIDQDGRESNFILQEKIEGWHLYELTDEELRKPVLKENLLKFLAKVERMWQEVGRVPDLCREKKFGLSKFFDDVRYSRNTIVDDSGKIWLVDTSANPLVFSKKAKLRYKHVPRVLILSVRRFKKYLS